MIAGLIVAGTHSGPRIVAAAVGLAIAATVGMSAGEYLSDTSRSIHLAVVMGVATFVGSVAPALPFLFGYGTPQILASVLIVVVAGVLIGRVRGYRITFLILALVAVLTVAVSALIG